MILITGGAGYIGSHCVIEFLKNNLDAVVFDNFSKGHSKIIDKIKSKYDINFFKGDLRNKNDIDLIFKKYDIEAVVHFAGFSEVSASTVQPKMFYENNVLGTLNLLNSMVENKVLNIIFSSSAAVYGEAKYVPMDENHQLMPKNPYGKTKLIIENILDDYEIAYNLKSVKLRYFNVIGANYKENIGEWHDIETHLVPNILKSSLIDDYVFNIFGDDYETKDGTCIRDYVDVQDLVHAHYLAYKYLIKSNKSDIFNLGSGKEYSVKDVYNCVCKVLGYKIPFKINARRKGDPAILIADSSKARKVLNWSNETSLIESISNAYEWEKILKTF